MAKKGDAFTTGEKCGSAMAVKYRRNIEMLNFFSYLQNKRFSTLQ